MAFEFGMAVGSGREAACTQDVCWHDGSIGGGKDMMFVCQGGMAMAVMGYGMVMRRRRSGKGLLVKGKLAHKRKY